MIKQVIMAKEQVYIRQDLGISQEELQNVVSQYELAYDLIQEGEPYDLDKVVGLVTINKALPASEMASFPNLKFVAVAFTGFDSVDLDFCKDNKVAVYNVPTYATNSVAELTLGTAISLLREIPKGNTEIRKGQWNLGRNGSELFGKRIGIVGTGRIGIRVAELFKAFGCEVYAWSKSKREEFERIGTYVSDLKELAAQVDILCLHTPLTPQTKHLINEEVLDVMLSESYLINMARGPVVDQNALVETLKNGKIAGAAVDVFDQEPIDSDHPYCELNNALLTPHIAFKTNEALKRRAEITVQNILGFQNRQEVNRVL
jgi:D-3-phosphoglycerate dehydrogenase